MKTMILAVMLAATALPSAQVQRVYTERFGTKYLAGRLGLKPFDSGLTIAENRIIVTTSHKKKGFFVEAFSIPLETITSAEATHARRQDKADLTAGWTNGLEYITIVTESPTGAEALVFQAAPLEGAAIVTKINFAIKQLLKEKEDVPQNVQPPPLSAELQASIEKLRTLAENGDADAQMLAGALFYDSHRGADAAVWLRRAADQGQGFAQGLLGDILFKGIGVPQDFAEAAKWSRKSADQGVAMAQLNLAAMYFGGKGVAEDAVAATKWAREAAEQECDAPALRICAQARQLVAVAYFSGGGVPQDYLQAHKWANLAAAVWPSTLGPNKAAKLRDDVAGRMTVEQIAEAQRLAREWKPHAPK